jgi:predicted RNA-binding protein with PUA-like domain
MAKADPTAKTARPTKGARAKTSNPKAKASPAAQPRGSDSPAATAKSAGRPSPAVRRTKLQIAPQAPARSPAAAWLIKSEPEVFSFDDLLAAPRQRTGWDGIRNYQVRNYLRDDLRVGDLLLYYHSNSQPPGIVGTARVVSPARPDPTQFDPASPYFDPGSEPSNPRWLEVEIEAEAAWARPLGLPELRAEPRLAGLALLAKGSRLSVLPVGAEHLAVILELAQGALGDGLLSQKSAGRSPQKRPSRPARGPKGGPGHPKT